MSPRPPFRTPGKSASRQRRWLAAIFCLGLALTISTTPQVPADVVIKTDGTLVFGRISRVDDRAIDFRERFDSGRYIERRFQLDEVADWMLTIDEDQLRQLTPERPLDYFQLAEWLSIRAIDPEARELAIRLYLIAARLNEGPIRRSSFYGLVALARSAEEEKKFRGLAFLNDRSLPGEFLSPTTIDGELSAKSLGVALAVVQGIRRGDSAANIPDESSAEIASVLNAVHSPISLPRLRSMATQPQLELADLLDLLRLERRLQGRIQGLETGDPETWSESAAQGKGESEIVPSWNNVSEFDPAQVYFRQGRWTTLR